MTDDKYTLYEIDIQTPVSPQELRDFADLLDSAGYTVVTDLEYGAIEVRDTVENYSDD